MHEGVCAASFPLKLEKLEKEGKFKKESLREGRESYKKEQHVYVTHQA